MIKSILTILVLFQFTTSLAQEITPDIQKINISDKGFIKNITDYIEDQKGGQDEFGFFKKGLGYVSVQISDYHHQDTLLRYYVLAQASSFDKDSGDILYPQYYTFIDGHPILLYFRSVNMISALKYSENSKIKFRKVIEKCLDKPKNTDFYDVNNKKIFTAKKFQNSIYNYGGAKIFYKLGRQYEE